MSEPSNFCPDCNSLTAGRCPKHNSSFLPTLDGKTITATPMGTVYEVTLDPRCIELEKRVAELEATLAAEKVRAGEWADTALLATEAIDKLQQALAVKGARLEAAEMLLSWITKIVEEHGDFVDALATYHAKYAEKGEVKNG